MAQKHPLYVKTLADGPALSTRAEHVYCEMGGKTIRVSVTKWESNCRHKESDYKIFAVEIHALIQTLHGLESEA